VGAGGSGMVFGALSKKKKGFLALVSSAKSEKAASKRGGFLISKQIRRAFTHLAVNHYA
jgi:hypothetical protein